jgi:hypothetical protein
MVRMGNGTTNCKKYVEVVSDIKCIVALKLSDSTPNENMCLKKTCKKCSQQFCSLQLKTEKKKSPKTGG